MKLCAAQLQMKISWANFFSQGDGNIIFMHENVIFRHVNLIFTCKKMKFLCIIFSCLDFFMRKKVRKLPVTWGKVMFFTVYSTTYNGLVRFSHNTAEKSDDNENSKFRSRKEFQ